MATKLDVGVSAQDLHDRAVRSGAERRVKVNQRQLIDKILARYSSDFVVFRELIQNADDARATSFQLSISCPQPDAERYKSATELRHPPNEAWNELEQRLRASQRRTNGSSKSNTHSQIDDFHGCEISELRAMNNGQPFSEVDWERVAAIADGNIDVNSVGQFGVGFFSVFSYSDAPIVISGKEYLVFAWRDDNTLTTYRQKWPADQRSQWTSILIRMRRRFVLHTRPIENAKKKSRLDEITPNIDLPQLKNFFTRILSFTRNIKELLISINDRTVFQVTKSTTVVPSPKRSTPFEQLSLHPMFQLGSLVHSQQTFTIANGSSLTLDHVAVEAKVTVNEEFHQRIEHSLKKRLPPTVSIQLLYASQSSLNELHLTAEKGDDLLRSLIPMKWEKGSLVPSGLIFIGFATHQTTGIGLHIHSHLIPTIERESLDLQDPHIAVWNRELLALIGQLARFIYDRTLSENIQRISGSAIFAPFAFRITSPDSQIGEALFRGFLSSPSPVLVPVRKSPLHPQLSLIPSSEALLATSASLHEFLDVPLVPFELAQCEFFAALKKNELIVEVTKEMIFETLSKLILVPKALVTLLIWLRKEHANDKQYVQRLFSVVCFYEHLESTTVLHLKRIKSYDTLNVSEGLPLPPEILPRSIARHFAVEDLRLHFSLGTCKLKFYLDFYLSDSQSFLFRKAKTSEEPLRFISKSSSQLTDAYWTQIKEKLAQIRCISTTKGMKYPGESFLPSSLADDDQPMVNFNLSAGSIDDESIPIAFLKRIGCRIFNGNSIGGMRKGTASSSEEMRMLIRSLVEERSNLTEADLQSLKETRFLTGTPFGSAGRVKRECAANELHFPSVGVQLKWPSLLVIDWFDIDPHSAEYAFLKEIGVREVPDLTQLLDRIVEEHHPAKEYQLPVELLFFATHFQTDYSTPSDLNKCQRDFLPSTWPGQPNNVLLFSPANTFTEISPLCPTLLPAVTSLFNSRFRLLLLGVNDKPTLTQAFDLLMEKKGKVLKTVARATNIFNYLSELEGRNPLFIERVSKMAFIPCLDHGPLMKPTEVFIRSSVKQSDKEEEEIDTRGLIDFVHFGSQANEFLLGIGVHHFPSATVLAQLLLDRQETYFTDADQSGTKQKTYLYCLKQLAMSDSLSHELMIEPMKTRLTSEPWCLGYQMLEAKNGTTERICKIVTPGKIYLDDDHSLAVDLKPLCSPDEPLLTDFYHKFGSSWLTDCAKREIVHTGQTNDTDRSRELKERIVTRLKMLFVDNQGSPFPHLDANKVALISDKKFTVLETEGIKGSVSFEGKQVKIKANSKNSCTLECQKDRVTLYLLTDQPGVDYFHVARALARFVFKKPVETYFDSICSRLELSLDALRERGIPVDRLIKPIASPQTARVVQDQPSPSPSVSQRPTQPISAQPLRERPQKPGIGMKLLGIIPWLLGSKPRPAPVARPIDDLEDFRPSVIAQEEESQRMIDRARSFRKKKFKSGPGERIEDIQSCTLDPSTHLVRSSYTFDGIPLYIEVGIFIDQPMRAAANQLAPIIKRLAEKVFQVRPQTTHLFRDTHSARIAFNSNGAIFFNLRYYEQVFEPELQQTRGSSSITSKIVNFYYLTFCHELSHNLHQAHDNQFINQMESTAVKFMSAKDLYLPTLRMASKAVMLPELI